MGPQADDMAEKLADNVFQHSLVSLFWGHTTTAGRITAVSIVSALSGESILGPLDWH